MRISPGLCWIFQSSWVQMKEQTEYLYANYGFILFPVGLGGFQGGYEAPKPPNLGVRRHEAPKPPKRWWMVVDDQVRVHHFYFWHAFRHLPGYEKQRKVAFFNICSHFPFLGLPISFFSPCNNKKKHDFAYFFKHAKQPANVNFMLLPLQNTPK